MKLFKKVFIVIVLFIYFANANSIETNNRKTIVYIPISAEIPFWQIMAKGINNVVEAKGYKLEILDANNSSKKELENIIKAVKQKVAGVIISPSNSSAAVTILEIAENANIPVVIADIGSDGGKYVSYISSKNQAGAYSIGKLLTKKMIEKDWQNGKVGIIAIPQKRLNGQKRTAGFMKALQEKNIKGADIKQLHDWTDEETYNFTKEFITNFPDLRAIWLQTSSIYKGAIKAIKELKKEKELILVAFDAEPEFLELIEKRILIGSGMQQPYIMGRSAAKALTDYLDGKKVQKNISISIITVTPENLKEIQLTIEHNVLGIE